jgi:hypothetical protein
LVATVFAVANLTFFALCSRWPRVKREISSDMYGASAVWLVSSIYCIPTNFLLSLGMLPPLYILADFHVSTLPKVWILLAISGMVHDSIAELGSPLGVLNGFGIPGICNMMGALASGAFISKAQIIWPLRLFCYILPTPWCLSGLVSVLVLGSNDFSGAVATPNGTFECPDGNTACFGITGADVARALHATFEAADPDINWQVNAGWITLIFVVVRLLVLMHYIVDTRPARGVADARPAGRRGEKPTEKSALLGLGGALIG